MAYEIFRRSDNINPFTVVNENTLDSTTTSIFLVGRRKENYGQPQNQNFLWLLENFANSIAPQNAILGQSWFNTVDGRLYVCTDETAQTFRKVSRPLVSNTPPNLSLAQGDLWYNPVQNKIFVWTGTAWSLIGPESTVPLTVREEFFLNTITTNAAVSQMWLNGINPTVLNMPNNTTWLFEVTLVARRTDASGERRTWTFSGMIDNTGNNVSLDTPVAGVLLASSAGTSNWAAQVVADNSAKSLRINVTGEGGKTISWNAVVRLTKIS